MWNLPFAKTVQIVGLKNAKKEVVDEFEEDSRLHYLAADSYKLEIDTSALFSIIFVSNSTFTDYDDTKDLRTLNYTFLGKSEMLEY